MNTQDRPEYEEHNLYAADDWESSQESHGASNKTYLGLHTNLSVFLDVVKGGRVKVDPHHLKCRRWCFRPCKLACLWQYIILSAFTKGLTSWCWIKSEMLDCLPFEFFVFRYEFQHFHCAHIFTISVFCSLRWFVTAFLSKSSISPLDVRIDPFTCYIAAEGPQKILFDAVSPIWSAFVSFLTKNHNPINQTAIGPISRKTLLRECLEK